jgi:microcystin-dependent protein
MASDPFLSEIQIFAFDFAPVGWLQCAGQLVSIQQNSALFALLGTTYGGNGITNFGIPDLRGRVPMHINGPLTFQQGQNGGEEAHTLTVNEMPLHTHQVKASGANVDLPNPSGNLWAKGADAAGFRNTAGATMSASAISQTGSNQSHENRSPFLVLNFCIATQGIFPARN